MCGGAAPPRPPDFHQTQRKCMPYFVFVSSCCGVVFARLTPFVMQPVVACRCVCVVFSHRAVSLCFPAGRSCDRCCFPPLCVSVCGRGPPLLFSRAACACVPVRCVRQWMLIESAVGSCSSLTRACSGPGLRGGASPLHLCVTQGCRHTIVIGSTSRTNPRGLCAGSPSVAASHTCLSAVNTTQRGLIRARPAAWVACCRLHARQTTRVDGLPRSLGGGACWLVAVRRATRPRRGGRAWRAR